MSVLGNFGKYFGKRPVSGAAAQKILGTNYISQERMEAVLGTQLGEQCIIRHTLADIKNCAQQNRRGEKWVMFCESGLSLRRLRESKPGEFSLSSVWGTNLQLLRDGAVPSMALVNLKPRPLSVLKKIWGERVMPLDVATVAEALIALKAENDVRLFAQSFHVGETAGDKVLLVGEYQDDGMLVHTLPKEVVDAFPMQFRSAYRLLPK